MPDCEQSVNNILITVC